MPAGLEVFDAQGRVMLSVTDRITRHVGTITPAVEPYTGSIYVPEFAGATPWWRVSGFFEEWSRPLPRVSVNGATLTWSYTDLFGGVIPAGARAPVFIIYGTY